MLAQAKAEHPMWHQTAWLQCGHAAGGACLAHTFERRLCGKCDRHAVFGQHGWTAHAA